jgi:hypothetical protein
MLMAMRKNSQQQTKAKCKRADSADMKHFTSNKHCGLLNVNCFEMPACT